MVDRERGWKYCGVRNLKGELIWLKKILWQLEPYPLLNITKLVRRVHAPVRDCKIVDIDVAAYISMTLQSSIENGVDIHGKSKSNLSHPNEEWEEKTCPWQLDNHAWTRVLVRVVESLYPVSAMQKGRASRSGNLKDISGFFVPIPTIERKLL